MVQGDGVEPRGKPGLLLEAAECPISLDEDLLGQIFCIRFARAEAAHELKDQGGIPVDKEAVGLVIPGLHTGDQGFLRTIRMRFEGQHNKPDGWLLVRAAFIIRRRWFRVVTGKISRGTLPSVAVGRSPSFVGFTVVRARWAL